jgi:3',5'-cyclic AMP phosphodiesterase CpdA
MPSGMSFEFRLAHLSDLHIGPLPPPSLHELLGKRLTGYWNWNRSRHRVHNMAMLQRIMADIQHQAPDHIALTGDLVNIGLPSEFPPALRLAGQLGPPDRVSIIPGNHDAYVRHSLPAMLSSFTPYMRGDDLEKAEFPYMRIRGRIALIGLCSAIPTGPFLASGSIGKTQAAKLRQMLEATAGAGFVRVVMIHHSPLKDATRLGRGLRDAISITRLLSEAGAELVIHGHNHLQSVEMLPRRNGPSIQIVGVASASAVPGTARHRAAYHLYTITIDAAGLSIELAARGLDASERIVELNRQSLLEIPGGSMAQPDARTTG